MGLLDCYTATQTPPDVNKPLNKLLKIPKRYGVNNKTQFLGLSELSKCLFLQSIPSLLGLSEFHGLFFRRRLRSPDRLWINVFNNPKGLVSAIKAQSLGLPECR